MPMRRRPNRLQVQVPHRAAGWLPRHLQRWLPMAVACLLVLLVLLLAAVQRSRRAWLATHQRPSAAIDPMLPDLLAGLQRAMEPLASAAKLEVLRGVLARLGHIDAALAAGPLDPAQPPGTRGWSARDEGAHTLLRILHHVGAKAQLMTACQAEPGLMLAALRGELRPGQAGTPRLLLAGNLKDAGRTMPNLVLQVLRLAAALPPGHLHVSLYESGSRDQTRAWLDALQHLLPALAVPATIVVDGLARAPHVDRIDFLAQVRNLALVPLFGRPASPPPGRVAAAEADVAQAGSVDHRSPDASRTILFPPDEQQQQQQHEDRFPADQVAFVNDVFFCAEHVLRLASYGADLACGLDFDKIFADLPMDQKRAAMEIHLHRHWQVPRGLAASAARSFLWFRIWKRFYRKAPSLLELLPPLFYDVWVARDWASGRRFTRMPPFVPIAGDGSAGRQGLGMHANASDGSGGDDGAMPLQRMRSGQPFRVHCCWNGLAVIDARPLSSGAVRFRAVLPEDGTAAGGEGFGRRHGGHAQGSEHGAAAGAGTGAGQDVAGGRSGGSRPCAASECSLLCDDLWVQGYQRAVVDPSVRVGYTWAAARDANGAMLRDGAEGFPGFEGAAGYAPWLPGLVQAVQQGELLMAGGAAGGAEGRGGRRSGTNLIGAAVEGADGVAERRVVECCDLQPGQDSVDFESGCRVVQLDAARAGMGRGPGG